MSEAAGQFTIDPDWQALDGPVFGLTQSALVATLRVQLADGFDFAPLDAAMADFIEDAAPVPASYPRAEDALAARAIHWAGAIQRRFGVPVSHRFAIEPPADAGDRDRIRAYIPYASRSAAEGALRWIGLSLRHYLAHGRLAEADGRIAEEVRRRLSDGFAPHHAPANVFRALQAAERLEIPVSEITQTLYQFGIGQGSRLLNSSFIDTTGVIGVRVAANKLATAILLRRAGLPAPDHELVENEADAVAAAARLGYPVVVKPNNHDQGRGVAAGLVGESDLRAAFAEARKLSPHILVERHFAGLDFRLTVLDGEVLQVIGRRPGGVTGDGRHSLAELVARQAARPESRRRARDFGMKPLALDDEALALAREQGLGAGDVVAEGRFVMLRRRANVSSGGEPYSVPLDAVHPDNLALAVRAAAAIRLDLAGVDLIIPDIARSWLDSGALICEINGQPQISQTGSPRIYDHILRRTVGERHTVPIAVYLAREPHPRLAACARPEATVGAASAAGVWLNGARVAPAQEDGHAAATALFADPAIAAAVIHLTPRDVVARGLPMPRCDMAVVAADALDDVEAIAWLGPNVRGKLVLPPSPRPAWCERLPAGRLSFRDDPWTAIEEFIAAAPLPAPEPA